MRTLKLPFKLPAKFPLQVNKIEYNGETLIDLTNDTITPEDVTKGVTFHMADGTEAVGTRQNIDFLDIYPIGAIYISANDVDPSTLFGGTWERIKDKFLLASGDDYSLGATGGEATHTLTVNEMPSHKHSVQTFGEGTYGADKKGVAFFNSQDSNGGSWVNDDQFMVAARRNMSSTTFTSTLREENLITKSFLANTGNSQSHNNMPPYLAINVWQRIS